VMRTGDGSWVLEHERDNEWIRIIRSMTHLRRLLQGRRRVETEHFVIEIV